MNKITPRILTLIAFMVLILVPVSLYATGMDKVTGFPTPESILHDIKSRGTRSVLKDLYDNETVWRSIMQGIAFGNESWLKVAVALRPGSDAGASEMLALAIGEALEQNSYGVLALATQSFELSEICGGPDVDDIRYDSLEFATKAIELRIAKVASIKDSSLLTVAKMCLRYLENSKKDVARFYGSHKR